MRQSDEVVEETTVRSVEMAPDAGEETKHDGKLAVDGAASCADDVAVRKSTSRDKGTPIPAAEYPKRVLHAYSMCSLFDEMQRHNR